MRTLCYSRTANASRHLPPAPCHAHPACERTWLLHIRVPLAQPACILDKCAPEPLQGGRGVARSLLMPPQGWTEELALLGQVHTNRAAAEHTGCSRPASCGGRVSGEWLNRMHRPRPDCVARRNSRLTRH